jgi:hypothetical protein
LTLEDLVEQADLIVLGSCAKITSEWDAEGKRIFTYITVVLGRCLKGSDCPGRLQIRQLGGKVDSTLMKISGAPKFNQGETVILFLKRSCPAYYRIIGLSQGKFSVVRRGYASYVIRNLNELTLMKRSDGGFRLEQRNDLDRELDLTTFIGKVEFYLRCQ